VVWTGWLGLGAERSPTLPNLFKVMLRACRGRQTHWYSPWNEMLWKAVSISQGVGTSKYLKSSYETPFQSIKAGRGSTHLPFQISRRPEVGGSWSRPTQAKTRDTTRIETTAKKDWGCSLSDRAPPSKHTALTSNPRITNSWGHGSSGRALA
jgi:hypothetical protein